MTDDEVLDLPPMAPYPVDVDSLIREVAEKFGLPLDIILDARQDRIPQQPGPSRAARAVRKKSPKL